MKYKFSRIYHLPWSEGTANDDKILYSLDYFKDKEIVVTLKLDGENTSLYSDCIHARSLDSKNHPSRNLVKALHGQIKHQIPKGFRIIGENLYAKHSIHYKDLESYFYVFAIYDENNNCLSWNDTIEYSKMLNLTVAPVLYRGIWDEEKIKSCYDESQEGYVVRIAESFPYELGFSSYYIKYVRKNHVQTSEHWMNEKIIPNLLKETL